MAGRPRKIIDVSTGKIGKKAIQNRKEQESKLKLSRGQLEAPEWLSEEAKKEFDRVVEEAKQIDILDNLDLIVLSTYCNATVGYSKTVEIIARERIALFKIDKYGNEISYSNPALVAQEKYFKQIMQCSTKLGLATTDRLKLIIPTKEEPKENKFIKLLKQKQG